MSMLVRRSVCAALLPFAVGIVMAAPAFAQTNSSGAAAEVMAAVKTQWDAENKRESASRAMGSIADDYTEFNPDVPVLIEGKSMAARFYDASLQSGDKGLASEMINPHVQVYGETAILTYNFAGMTKANDGKVNSNFAKSTRVYVKQNGRWMLVHANFAPVGMTNNP